MYEQYWRLDRMPFESRFDGQAYYPCEAHQGSLLKIRYAIESRREGVLLAGAAGTGKTLLAYLLTEQLGETFSPRLRLVFPQLPPAELLAWLAAELAGQEGTEPTPPHAAVRRIEQTLTENVQQGRHAIVVIDDAQDLVESGALETVRLLLNFTVEGAPPATIVLVGQSTILPALDRLSGLEEKMGVKCLLRPLSMEETVSYVNHRLTAAGATDKIFENEALEAVYHLSGGVPRRINRLCDLSLLIGFAEEQTEITLQQVESVADELVHVTAE